MSADYDIVTVGGGLGGSALAKAMAERGYRTLVVERETAFKDRIRGEQMATWGTAEAKELGLYELLTDSCAHEMVWWDAYMGSARVLHRDLLDTTPQGLPNLTFYHPAMQETLLSAAAQSGAEVRRGVRVGGVEPGRRPKVRLQWDGRDETVECRLVVACDGRSSGARAWGASTTHHAADRTQIAGLLFDGMTVPQDTAHMAIDVLRGGMALLFPQGGGRVRSYITSWKATNARHQGEKDIPQYIQDCISIGIPESAFENARSAGPLATFDGADTWVEHPYSHGIALLGDAAATSDPCWGQGLSLTMRDVRTLRDNLLANDDWEAAGHAYAEEHDAYFHTVYAIEDWFTKLFHEPGPEANARRARVLSKGAIDMEGVDVFQSGPDHATADEATRRRFFAEE